MILTERQLQSSRIQLESDALEETRVKAEMERTRLEEARKDVERLGAARTIDDQSALKDVERRFEEKMGRLERDMADRERDAQRREQALLGELERTRSELLATTSSAGLFGFRGSVPGSAPSSAVKEKDALNGSVLTQMVGTPIASKYEHSFSPVRPESSGKVEAGAGGGVVLGSGGAKGADSTTAGSPSYAAGLTTDDDKAGRGFVAGGKGGSSVFPPQRPIVPENPAMVSEMAGLLKSMQMQMQQMQQELRSRPAPVGGAAPHGGGGPPSGYHHGGKGNPNFPGGPHGKGAAPVPGAPAGYSQAPPGTSSYGGQNPFQDQPYGDSRSSSHSHSRDPHARALIEEQRREMEALRQELLGQKGGSRSGSERGFAAVRAAVRLGGSGRGGDPRGGGGGRDAGAHQQHRSPVDQTHRSPGGEHDSPTRVSRKYLDSVLHDTMRDVVGQAIHEVGQSSSAGSRGHSHSKSRGGHNSSQHRNNYAGAELPAREFQEDRQFGPPGRGPQRSPARNATTPKGSTPRPHPSTPPKGSRGRTPRHPSTSPRRPGSSGRPGSADGSSPPKDRGQGNGHGRSRDMGRREPPSVGRDRDWEPLLDPHGGSQRRRDRKQPAYDPDNLARTHPDTYKVLQMTGGAERRG